MDNLTEQELKAVFDVVNVYEPQDIAHVYPGMATDEFMHDINSAWKKILLALKGDDFFYDSKNLAETHSRDHHDSC